MITIEDVEVDKSEGPPMTRHVEIVTYALARAAKDSARRKAYPKAYSGALLKMTRTHVWLRRDTDRRVIAVPFARIKDMQEI